VAIAFPSENEGEQVSPSDSSDSDDISCTSGGGTAKGPVAQSGVGSGTSPKERARRGCMCLPLAFRADLAFESGEVLGDGGFVHPGR
jgi:hypothetical protein